MTKDGLYFGEILFILFFYVIIIEMKKLIF